MKILNEEIKEKFSSQSLIDLELGSGGKSKLGYYSLDLLPLDGVDIQADLNLPLIDIPTDSVKHVFTRHTLEHIKNLDQLMSEIHRIVSSSGKIEVVVPHFSNPYFFSDPTHVRFFGLYSMYYYSDHEDQPDFRKVPSFYNNSKFYVESINIEFYSRGLIDIIINPILKRLVNYSFKFQDFYERRLCRLFHAHQIRYIIRPKK